MLKSVNTERATLIPHPAERRDIYKNDLKQFRTEINSILRVSSKLKKKGIKMRNTNSKSTYVKAASFRKSVEKNTGYYKYRPYWSKIKQFTVTSERKES